MYTLAEIVNSNPLTLATDMAKEYYLCIPTEINDIQSMEKAGKMLGELTNKYSYLLSTLLVVKVMVRQLKKEKNKEACELMIARRDILQDSCDMIKQQYNAISRMISTKSEINREMNMK